MLEVRAGKDDEGDPYWRTMMVGQDGRERMVAKGCLAALQEAPAARLRTALRLA